MRGFRFLPQTTFILALGLAAAAQAEVGITSVTSGDPLGQPPAQPERILRVGLDVQANERVTTKADDRAHLVFLDGTSLTVGPNSAIVLDKFVYDPDKKAGELSLKAAKGVFRLVGGNISKTNDIQITTPTASIGIRGGIVNFEVGDRGETRANFVYGQSMTVTSQGSTQTATRNGSQIRVDSGQPPAAPTLLPAPPPGSTASFERPVVAAVVAPAAAVAVQAQARPVIVTPVAATPVVTTQTIDRALTNSSLSKGNSHRKHHELSEVDRQIGRAHV